MDNFLSGVKPPTKIITAGLVRVPYAHGLSRASCPPSKGIANAIISPHSGYQVIYLSFVCRYRGKSLVEALRPFKSGYQMRVCSAVADKRCPHLSNLPTDALKKTGTGSLATLHHPQCLAHISHPSCRKTDTSRFRYE